MKHLFLFLALSVAAAPAAAQPEWRQGEGIGDTHGRDHRFRSGETLPDLRLHYVTRGTPHYNAAGEVDNAVMILHGTGGSGAQFLQPQFAGELFGPGQPLDTQRYFIILPDAIGHGLSSKPSNGLRMRFPHYDYRDMIEGYRIVLASNRVRRLRLVIGTSMGCMHIFTWAEAHPDFARAALPLACLPAQIAGHNRMWRQLAIQNIRRDPAWQDGNYASQPVTGLRGALSILQLAGWAPLYLQREYPTREAADAFIAERVERDLATRDANDLIYQLEASSNYNPLPDLERIRVPMTWINSADDFINPPEYGIAEAAARRMPTARYILIPRSAETRGHGTHTWARFWNNELVDLLRRTE